MARKQKPKKAKFFTVKDLKKLLDGMPDDMLFGRVGYFGEFCPMSEDSFYRRKAMVGNSPDDYCWRDIVSRGEQKEVLAFEPPEIGPEPD